MFFQVIISGQNAKGKLIQLNGRVTRTPRGDFLRLAFFQEKYVCP